MTTYETALSATVRRLVPVEEDMRAVIVSTAVEATEGRPAHRRLRELASLVGLGLRLRGRWATGDVRSHILSQSAALGAALVLLATAAWIRADGGALSATSATVVALLIGGALLPWRWVRIALVAAGAALWFVSVEYSMPVLAGLVVGTALTAMGFASVRHTYRRWLGVCVAVSVLGEVVATALTGSGWLTTGVITMVAAVGPLLLLAVGWFDARFAFVATAVWFWRLAAVDLGDLVSAVADLGRELTLDVLIVRWMAMGAGVLIGIVVSQRALRHATTL